MSDLENVTYPDTGPTDDDLATLLAKREHARPNRLTWALLVLLVLALGFVGGAFVQARVGGASSSTRLPDFAAAATGSGSGFPAAGQGGQPAGMTFGTVKLVDGNRLYLTDSSGQTVTVTVPTSATVTAQTDVALSDLAAGTTVIVRGETGTDGTVTATSVSQGSLPGGGPGTSTGTGTGTRTGTGTSAPSPAQSPTTQEGTS
jgi:hypothetical protein